MALVAEHVGAGVAVVVVLRGGLQALAFLAQLTAVGETALVAVGPVQDAALADRIARFGCEQAVPLARGIGSVQ